MDVLSKSDIVDLAFALDKKIDECLLCIRDHYLELGEIAIELKKDKKYKLVMPEAEDWPHYVSMKMAGLKVAQIDNYGYIAKNIGSLIRGRDIKLNRALDITRLVRKLPGPEKEKAISELIESAETLPASGWRDVLRVMQGQTPSDECTHEETEIFTRCKKCNRWLKT